MERPDAAEFQEAIDAVLASVKDLSAEDGTAICPHCRGGLAGLNPSAVKVIQSAAKGNQGLLTLVLGLLSQQSELATKIDSVADLLRLINAPGARAAASGEPMDLDAPSTSGRSHGPAPASEEATGDEDVGRGRTKNPRAQSAGAGKGKGKRSPSKAAGEPKKKKRATDGDGEDKDPDEWMRSFNCTRATFLERRAAGHCYRCGQPGHRVEKCTKPKCETREAFEAAREEGKV